MVVASELLSYALKLLVMMVIVGEKATISFPFSFVDELLSSRLMPSTMVSLDVGPSGATEKVFFRET